MNDIKTIVGKRIRDRRKALGLSQEQLAVRLDTQHTYVSDIENGRRNLTLLTLEMIARQLEVEVFELLVPQIDHDKINANETLQREATALLATLDSKELNIVVSMLREIAKNRTQ